MNLKDGQAVLYGATNGPKINGLENNTIYFVSVEKPTTGANAGKTLVIFYDSQAEAVKTNFITKNHSGNFNELSLPSNTGATHTLKEVPLIDGKDGEDRIITQLDNLANVVLGAMEVIFSSEAVCRSIKWRERSRQGL